MGISSVTRIPPGPGQESVWDYPRPPRLEPEARRIEIDFGGVKLVDTTNALRVLETSHPPVYYIPKASFMLLNHAHAGYAWCHVLDDACDCMRHTESNDSASLLKLQSSRSCIPGVKIAHVVINAHG